MSSGQTAGRIVRLRSGPILGALVIAAGMAATAHSAQAPRAEDLADVEAKAQYDYFTQDLRALEQLTREIKSWGQSNDGLERYHYAHAKFRLQQTALATGHAPEAGTAGQDCVAALDSHVSGPLAAESLVLSGLCQGFAGSVSGLRKALNGARRLEPRNPRVMLGEAYADSLADSSGAIRSSTLAAMKDAAAAFDKVTAPAPGAPTWGSAEAWLLLGEGLARTGDAFAARNAYERCLVIAPDFHAARQSLAALGVGAR
jgi:tetratricopeptide (TPR) repeat protein